MEREIVLGDILTPQEHNWLGSTPDFNPTSEKEWHIPDGVLRGKITLGEAIAERRNMGFVKGGFIASAIGIFNRNIAMSLEEIDEIKRQTKTDPKILGIWDRKTNGIVPAIDEATGEERDLTNDLINKFRERGLEDQLHLRPKPTGEKENPPPLGEGNARPKI